MKIISIAFLITAILAPVSQLLSCESEDELMQSDSRQPNSLMGFEAECIKVFYNDSYDVTSRINDTYVKFDKDLIAHVMSGNASRKIDLSACSADVNCEFISKLSNPLDELHIGLGGALYPACDLDDFLNNFENGFLVKYTQCDEMRFILEHFCWMSRWARCQQIMPLQKSLWSRAPMKVKSQVREDNSIIESQAMLNGALHKLDETVDDVKDCLKFAHMLEKLRKYPPRIMRFSIIELTTQWLEEFCDLKSSEVHVYSVGCKGNIDLSFFKVHFPPKNVFLNFSSDSRYETKLLDKLNEWKQSFYSYGIRFTVTISGVVTEF